MHLRGRGTVRLGGSLTSEALEVEIQESGVQRAGTGHFTCNYRALIVPPQNAFPNLGTEPGDRPLRETIDSLVLAKTALSNHHWTNPTNVTWRLLACQPATRIFLVQSHTSRQVFFPFKKPSGRQRLVVGWWLVVSRGVIKVVVEVDTG